MGENQPANATTNPPNYNHQNQQKIITATLIKIKGEIYYDRIISPRWQHRKT